MGGNSGSKGTSTTTNQIPAELSGLTSKTAGKIDYAQDQPGFDVSQYGQSHVQGVPGLSANQQQAVRQAQDVGGMTQGEGLSYGSLANANAYANQSSLPYAGQSSLPYASQSGRATGGTLATDPSMAAAYNTYMSTVKPDLESQFGLMGLSKSSLLGDALAKGAASQLQPATEASLAREQQANEARIARETGASEGRIGRETAAAENQYGRQTSTALNQAAQYAGLGNEDINRRLAQLNALTATGQLERGVSSEEEAAKQADYIRTQNLAEQSTFGTLGQLPSTLGQSVASKTSASGK